MFTNPVYPLILQILIQTKQLALDVAIALPRQSSTIENHCPLC